MIKVLHVISDENIGGAGILLMNLLRYFDRTELSNVVALPRGSALIPRLRELSVPAVELEAPCHRISLASIRELTGWIEREQVDVVHANAAISARIAAKQQGIPGIHTRHCYYPMRQNLWKQRLLGYWNNALSDLVIATAEVAAENLRALGISEEKIRVIPNGSPPVREVSEEELAFYRAKWKIPRDAFVVGLCARLEPCKGQDVFLHALRRMIELQPSTRVFGLLIGTGSQKGTLEAMAHSLGLEDRICFPGFLQDVAPAYRSMRVNINCSRGTETSCLALSEGMSTGLPMVVSAYGGNPAMIGESRAGILFPTDDHEALAETLLRIEGDPVLEAEMRQAAYRRYATCFTARRMAEQTAKVYREVLRR